MTAQLHKSYTTLSAPIVLATYDDNHILSIIGVVVVSPCRYARYPFSNLLPSQNSLYPQPYWLELVIRHY